MYSVFVRYSCVALVDFTPNIILLLYSILVDFTPNIILFTQVDILVWLDGTIIDISIDIISTIVVTMYYSGYVGL